MHEKYFEIIYSMNMPKDYIPHISPDVKEKETKYNTRLTNIYQTSVFSKHCAQVLCKHSFIFFFFLRECLLLVSFYRWGNSFLKVSIAGYTAGKGGKIRFESVSDSDCLIPPSDSLFLGVGGVRDRFNKQGNLYRRLVLGSHWHTDNGQMAFREK